MDKQAIAARLAAHLAATGMSQNRLAAVLKVSSATVSNLLSGKHEKIADAMFASIAQFLDAAASTTWATVETTTYATITNLLGYTQAYGVMRMAVAPAGAGKTFTARRYAATHAEVFYLECVAADNRREFMEGIARSMGLRPQPSDTMGSLLRKVADTANGMESPLLILDEASVLKSPKMQLVKDLFNATKGRLGILLLGVPYVYSSFVRYAKSEVSGFPELLSRIGHVATMTQADSAERARVASQNGLSAQQAKWVAQTCADLRAVEARVNDIKSFNLLGASVEDLAQLFKA